MISFDAHRACNPKAGVLRTGWRVDPFAECLGEAQMKIGILLELDSNGRCCGKKPLIYKRKGHLFCGRCCAQFNIETLKQEPNFGWLTVASGGFYPAYTIHPTGNVDGSYRKYLELTGGSLPSLKWQHQCPALGPYRHTNEHTASFLQCTCYSSSDFLAAQEALRGLAK